LSFYYHYQQLLLHYNLHVSYFLYETKVNLLSSIHTVHFAVLNNLTDNSIFLSSIGESQDISE